jgi:hypothetical protein
MFLFVFIAEGPMMYAGKWQTPLHFLDLILFQHSALKMPLFFYLQIILLIMAGSRPGAKAHRAPPMDKAINFSIASMLVWTILGAIRGGQPWQAGWQLYSFFSALLFAKLLMATLQTPKHFEQLGRTFMYAVLWRATMAIVFWFFFYHNVTYPEGPPPYMTIHDDTVVFVTGLILAIANHLVLRSRKSLRLLLLSLALILPAIQFNNRRLAWASLAFSIVVLYVMLPKGKLKRRINIGLLAAAPFIAMYVGVGWGHTDGIFKPLGALSSMSSKKDTSTLSRVAENKGLIVTLMRSSWLSGTGWGHEYVEVDSSFNIDMYFKQWKYVPHNSILGILAFSGALGFYSLWLVFPVGVFLNARTWRIAQLPTERIAAITSLTSVVITSNQMFGDMGFQSNATLFVASAGFAVAGRLSVSSGAWPDKKAARAKAAVTA